MIHELPLGSTRLHGAFSRDLSPVLTVDPGDSVRFSLPNSAWRLGPDEEIERPDPAVDTGHALLGPIEVPGARAGQTLAVRVDVDLVELVLTLDHVMNGHRVEQFVRDDHAVD